MCLPVFISVCLSVSKITQKRMHGFGWNVVWTNWLTFEPNPDYSPDAGTGLFLRYRIVLVRGILRWENPSYTYWHGLPLQRCMVLKWFYSLSRWNTFVGGTCAAQSVLLVYIYVANPLVAILGSKETLFADIGVLPLLNLDLFARYVRQCK